MAELNIFHYIPKNSVVHNIDGRVKLLFMVLFSVTSGLITKIPDFIILTAVLLAILFVSRLPFLIILREIKYFSFFIILIVLVHSFSIPGTPVSWLPVPGLTEAGVVSGLFFAWRLVLIILICTIFTGTTTLSLLRNVIEWFLRPVPFISETRVATMFSLTFVLIPMIFDQSSEMLEAQKARCVEGRKNPLQRVIFLTFPLLLHSFLRADEIALAMDARCYSGVRTRPLFKAVLTDWIFLACSVLICSIVILHTYFGR